MKNYVRITALLVAGLSLAACSGESKSTIDPVAAKAQCGVLVGLLGGDVSITASNYEEVMNTIETLADEGVGAIKPTAKFILSDMDGEEHSERDSEKTIDALKDFCLDYAVD